MEKYDGILEQLTTASQNSSKKTQNRLLLQLIALYQGLSERQIEHASIDAITSDLSNALNGEANASALRKYLSRLTKFLVKEFKIVTSGYYQTQWMAIGMSAFGIPFGAAFGAAMGNMAFLGIGIPIGMTMGIAIGSGMDKKAAQEGRMIDINVLCNKKSRA